MHGWSRVEPGGGGGSIHRVRPGGGGRAQSCLGGPVSGLVVEVEALPNNITTSIMMKQQVLSQRKGFRISLRGGF